MFDKPTAVFTSSYKNAILGAIPLKEYNGERVYECRIDDKTVLIDVKIYATLLYEILTENLIDCIFDEIHNVVSENNDCDYVVNNIPGIVRSVLDLFKADRPIIEFAVEVSNWETTEPILKGYWHVGNLIENDNNKEE